MKELKTSEKIRARLNLEGGSFHANDNIYEYMFEGEKQDLQREVEVAMEGVLNALVIDTHNDHNTKDTARRVAKMMMNEIYKGRYDVQPAMTEFPNYKKLGELTIVGPITVRSSCSHHMAPILGKCWVGFIPGENVIGLSKFVRLADWVMSRPQIQEEACVILADELEKVLNPVGLAVVVEAEHYCMKWRGVKESDCVMTNSVMRGRFMEDMNLRQEFMQFITKSK